MKNSLFNFNWKFTEMYSWRYANVVGGNGLVPSCYNSLSLLMLYNDLWHHMASLDYNELTSKRKKSQWIQRWLIRTNPETWEWLFSFTFTFSPWCLFCFWDILLYPHYWMSRFTDDTEQKCTDILLLMFLSHTFVIFIVWYVVVFNHI